MELSRQSTEAGHGLTAVFGLLTKLLRMLPTNFDDIFWGWELTGVTMHPLWD